VQNVGKNIAEGIFLYAVIVKFFFPIKFHVTFAKDNCACISILKKKQEKIPSLHIEALRTMSKTLQITSGSHISRDRKVDGHFGHFLLRCL
jgi:hypothetical protein